MEWINIEDRLPEIEKDVLVLDVEKTTSGNRIIKYFIASLWDDWCFYTDDELHILNATHWMPLPQPPKE